MHRSGIHNLEPDGSWGKQPRTKDEVVARIAQGQPDFEPDARHLYSNAGYILLGYIVEKAGGKPYQEALKERITSRIGLKDTYLGAGNTDPGKNEALSYRYVGGWKEAAELDFSIPGGAGSILSTPADMAKFIQALFDLKLVSQDSLKQMTTMRDDEGMGMEPFSFAGKTLYGHTGGSGSSGAWLAYYPDEKLALAYTTNAKIYPVSNIVSGVFDIYWNRPFQIPTFDAFDVSPEVLDRYVGVYSIPGTPAKVTVTRDGATLYFQPAGQSAVPIEATAEDKFKIEPFVVFEFDAAKREMTIDSSRSKEGFHEARVIDGGQDDACRDDCVLHCVTVTTECGEGLEPQPVHGEIAGACLAGAGGLPVVRRRAPAARRGGADRLQQGHVLPPALHAASVRVPGQGRREPLPAGVRGAPPAAVPHRIRRAGTGHLVRSRGPRPA